MACTYTEYPRVDPIVTHQEPVPGGGHDLSGPYAIVSNQPEIIPVADGNLCRCDIPLQAGIAQRFRVFVWHVSAEGSKNFSMRASMSAGTGQVTNFVGHVEHVSDADLVAPGQCCARALMYNQYPTTFADKTLGNVDIGLYAKTIRAERVLAAQFEFTVTASQAANFRFRTCVGNVPRTTDPLVADERHIRGWWPYSEAIFDVAGTLDVNPDAITPGFLICPILEVRDANDQRIVPPELQPTVFGHRSVDTYGWPLPFTPQGSPSPLGGNVGLYGVITTYRFTLSNSGLEPWSAVAEMYTRNNGGIAYGAAQIAGYPEFMTPVLHWVGGQAEGCRLSQGATVPQPIVVAPGTASQPVDISFTAGGASSLPAILRLSAGRRT